MPERIPQSATIRVPLQAYLASDHVSAATGKTIAITISKNGAAYGNPSAGATNATEIASGSYYVDLSTTDTGTAGPLFVKGAEGTIDTIIAIYNVVSAHNAGFDGVPDVASGSAGAIITAGSGTAQLNVASGKAPVTLASTDVTGNVAADIQTIKTQTVTCAAGVTVNVNVGTTQPTNFTGSGASALVKTDTIDINSVACSAVTTINANIGTTQPINFQGTGASAFVKSDIRTSLGVAVTNFDGTIAAATSSTVTFPTTDAGGNSIPDSGQYAYRVLYINGGTGLDQRVYLTTPTGTARQYNVLAGTMPTTLSTDSTYVDVGGWKVNTIQVNGTGQTAADLGSLATTINSSVGTPTDLGTGATLAANNVDMAGASFATSTDSQHAIRARGDAAWTTATGFSTFNAATDKVFLGDGAHGGTATVITLERMIGASTTTNQPCVKFTGNGTGQGIYALGGASASGFRSEGGATAGFGIHAVATAAGHDGIRGDASGTGGDGIAGNASGTSGHGMHATGSGASGIGMVFTGNTEDIQLGNSSADTLSAAVLKAGSITATVAPNLDAAISTRAVAGDAMTLTAAYDFAKGTTAATESYSALHAAPTPIQLLFEMRSMLQEKSVSGTTVTTKKVDGTTTAMTLTLDAATPSSITRAS